MRLRSLAFAAFLATIPSFAAQAFSVQDRDAVDAFGLPKFDIEEQAKNFRTDGSSRPSAMPKFEFETFLGKGTLDLGLHSGPSYLNAPLGSAFGPMGPAPRNAREDFNRVVTPENLR
jgi:hypothetical protein